MASNEAARPSSLVATNLQRLMRAARISQSELAKRTGVNQPSIHRIISGKNPSPRQDTIQALAAFFQISADDFRYRNLSDQSLLPFNFRGIRIPIMTAREVVEFAGKKLPKQSNGQYITLCHEMSDDAVAFTVPDRAMEPRFYVDDIIVYDPRRSQDHGKFVVARIEGMEEAVIRQLIRNGDGTSRLEALNRNQPYPYIIVKKDDNKRILGRVVLRIEKVL